MACGADAAEGLKSKRSAWQWVWLTPLCPAGHLPLKGGDWLGARSPLYPQRSRWPRPHRDSISLPVGEMSGRTEGGKPHPLPSLFQSRRISRRPSCHNGLFTLLW
ncbi:hypothetical protein CPJ18_07635 [Agrobacterium rosae]|uniref:Lytic murein transglycosylase n=1 Tax=Agrobacterium rosae TaxID=1972867 RepID=A0AAE5RYI5_9HYPH|nr:hypothetical protein CPJ18_07635 [Agrobacterium rosae]